MFNHISFGVSDLARSIRFYDAVMETLGHARSFGSEEEGFVTYGPDESYFIICLPEDESRAAQACNGSHICFRAKDRKQVEEFYRVAIARGAKDDGPPGFRPNYSEDYYAAFVLDPDGHQIEAMARVKPE